MPWCRPPRSGRARPGTPASSPGPTRRISSGRACPAPRRRCCASSNAGTTCGPRPTSTWTSTCATSPRTRAGTTWPVPRTATRSTTFMAAQLAELAGGGAARAGQGEPGHRAATAMTGARLGLLRLRGQPPRAARAGGGTPRADGPGPGEGRTVGRPARAAPARGRLVSPSSGSVRSSRTPPSAGGSARCTSSTARSWREPAAGPPVARAGPDPRRRRCRADSPARPSLPRAGLRAADRPRTASSSIGGRRGRSLLRRGHAAPSWPRLHDGSLPVGLVSDHPDLPVRGVMLDISRDKVPTMGTLAEP